MTIPQHTSRPGVIDREFLTKAVNITEVLANLIYLIHLDSGDRAKVIAYSALAEERLHALGDLLRTAWWES